MSKRLKPSDPHFDVPEVAACNCCRFGTVAFRLVGERKERADLLDREAKPPAMSDESKAAHIRSAVGAPSRGGAQGAGEETNILVEAERVDFGSGLPRQRSAERSVGKECVSKGRSR